MSKTLFREKLANIQTAYNNYIDEVIVEDMVVGCYKLKFNVMLRFIEDLYHGTPLEQSNSIIFLKLADLTDINDSLLLPRNMLNKMIYNPESYAAKIEYKDDEDDLLI